jgi:hypothetical protein
MTQTEAESADDAQILWGLVALVLAGVIATVMILHIYKLPFPGSVFFARDKTYPAPTAPVVSGKKHVRHPVVAPPAKPTPVDTTTQPPASPGPTNSPSPVSSSVHKIHPAPKRSKHVQVSQSHVKVTPAPNLGITLTIPPILVLPSKKTRLDTPRMMG